MTSVAVPAVKPQKLFIGGEWVEPSTGESFQTINPATEESITDIAKGDARDIDLAVAAARKTFDGGKWSEMPASKRGKLLWKLAEGNLLFDQPFY